MLLYGICCNVHHDEITENKGVRSHLDESTMLMCFQLVSNNMQHKIPPIISLSL